MVSFMQPFPTFELHIFRYPKDPKNKMLISIAARDLSLTCEAGT